MIRSSIEEQPDACDGAETESEGYGRQYEEYLASFHLRYGPGGRVHPTKAVHVNPSRGMRATGSSCEVSPRRQAGRTPGPRRALRLGSRY